MSFGRKKNMVSGKGLGHIPLTKPKNQYTKNRNGERQGDVTKGFFINNADVDKLNFSDGKNVCQMVCPLTTEKD